jgi:uncharacterized coiled-coil protein SlyX
MVFKKTVNAALLCAAVLVSGCSTIEDALFPAADNDEANAASDAAPTAAPVSSSTYAAPSSAPVTQSPLATQTPATGTFVGQKVVNLRNDLRQLQGTLAQQNQSLQAIRNQTVQDSQEYHGTIAAIQARLQVGTTPGNPVLTQQWNGAQGELDKVNDDVLKMTELSNAVTNSSGLSAYMLESVRAARQLSGAVDEDHRQLSILEDDTNRTSVLIERLLGELSTDITRQQQYIALERQNLNTLALAIKNGQLYGSSLGSQVGYAPPAFSGPAPNLASDAPLVTIRFDKPHVNYEGALYSAVKGAMDRRPDANFDVVAVSPVGGTPGQDALNSASTQRYAEQVARSLTNFGLPASRVRLSSGSSSGSRVSEVQIFVR